MKSPVICLFLICSLSSCATLSKNECLNGDWLTIGYEDGAKGESRERIGAHQEACSEYGIAPDFNTYQKGYDNGLLLFCTPRNGFIKGKGGYQYSGICPEKLESGFLEGYDGGREIYQHTVKSNSLNNELQSMDSRIADIEHEIRQNEHILLDNATPKDQRRRVYRTIEELKHDHYDLERRFQNVLEEKEEIDHRLDFLRRRYQAYQ
ncbi:DUF2799 domain-containing protein [Desulfopila aestuarii]|uniref:DUF2799 domain-containing protein n=1 Tax=Desulfopila aestuarii DSM 18488 TaxID=1121416 RepID=A0A1M7Y8R2_9BACT|nr:DUF2799 domain-containing protein [Desulfopila aestuarii]SHO48936.1 Protein of unknown function [Desulfopila aestuarii DSM 18488]